MSVQNVTPIMKHKVDSTRQTKKEVKAPCGKHCIEIDGGKESFFTRAVVTLTPRKMLL